MEVDYACICMVSVQLFERLQAARWRCAGSTGMWHTYPATCLPGGVSRVHVHQGCVGVSRGHGTREGSYAHFPGAVRLGNAEPRVFDRRRSQS
jgi:hypothetical protein